MDFKETKEFSSKWDEYRLGEWRRGCLGKTHVTLDTVIPEMPKEILEMPNENKFHQRQAEIDERIKEIGFTLEEKKKQFGEVLDAKKVNLRSDDSAGVVMTKELG